MCKKNLLVRLLAVTVAATMVLTPATVYAEGMEEVNAFDENITANLGDVRADGEKEDAVEICAEGFKADVTTGSLESADRNGLFTYAECNGEINVDVTGDINTPATISQEDERLASGITTNTLWGSQQNIYVNGNITSGDDGITVITYDSYEGDDPYAPSDEEYGDSVTRIRIDGDITADASGLEVTASRGGENHIEVTGNITGYAHGGDDPERDDGAIWVTANNKDSRNDIAIKGNVKGDKIGVWMVIPWENTGSPENNVVIDGTLSADVAAVVAEDFNNSGKNTLTVWKIETPGYTAAKWEGIEQDGADPTFYLDEDEETEKNIRYIIRVNKNDNATITATDENGNALATVTGVGGNVYEYAYEGDKILVKIDVADGYMLEAVYGDKGRDLQLIKDESGSFYVNVPRNGGVSIAVSLVKIDDMYHTSENDSMSAETAAVAPARAANGVVTTNGNKATGYANAADPQYSEQVVNMIASTPIGGVLNIHVSGSGLYIDEAILDALIARSDISVNIYFNYLGANYKINIPVGYDLKSLKAHLAKAGRRLDAAALIDIFGATPE